MQQPTTRLLVLKVSEETWRNSPFRKQILCRRTKVDRNTILAHRDSYQMGRGGLESPSGKAGVSMVENRTCPAQEKAQRDNHCTIAPVIQAHPLTLPAHHARVMQPIRLDTFADLLANGYGLSCYCSGCRRHAHANLGQLVAAGMGDEHISISRPKCRVCGSRGTWTVQPPVPAFHGTTWMQ